MIPIDDEYVMEKCKVGQGEQCCRYLVMGSHGWECAKLTDMKSLLDERVKQGMMTAAGDNCEGCK